jgi:septum formation protein
LGLPLLVRPGDVPEEREVGEQLEEFLARIVMEKLDAGSALAAGEPFSASIAADTVVIVDNEVLGKPIDTADARRLLAMIAGRSHIVTTRYAVRRTSDGATRQRSVSSEVFVRPASDAELTAYAATGEGLDKAGAYAIQGIGAFLVRQIRGSYTNVVGLPACEVVEDLAGLGLLGAFPEPRPSRSDRPSF